jgi:lipopolysaccharide biosynthesis glycosyltransferase
MNVILSFNTKNNPYVISSNVNESIKVACDNWNCKYIRIEESLQSEGFHDMFTKLYLPYKVTNFDRCLYLDTDILIKHDSPNPFELFDDDNRCYVVKDMQQPFLSDEIKQEFKNNQLCKPWYDECKRVLGVDLEYKKYNDNFFNAGMFLFTPKKHLYLFDHITDVLKLLQPPYPNIHQVEQALLNYTFMYYLKDNLIHIPKEWNYIDPPLDSNRMEGYIYHFTGWYYEKYKPFLKKYDLWKK